MKCGNAINKKWKLWFNNSEDGALKQAEQVSFDSTHVNVWGTDTQPTKEQMAGLSRS